MTTAANPYAPPVEIADSAAATDNQLAYKQTTFGDALFRWSGICIVAAGPSFFFGLAVTEARIESVIAMALGIAVFIFGYAAIDIQPFWRRWMSQPLTRRSIISAYAIRCIVSVVIPVGAANDMMCGALCLGSVGSLLEGDPMANGGMGPIAAFFVTLMQGVLLNVEIATVGILVYGILLAVRKINGDARQDRITTTEAELHA